MITEDYVSFETAKLLKEKGFDERGLCVYTVDNKELIVFGDWVENSCLLPHLIAAPTLQMAMKWLMKVHQLYIYSVPRWEDVEYMPGQWEEQLVGYQYAIVDIGEIKRKIDFPITCAITPESSIEAAIKYCIENLI